MVSCGCQSEMQGIQYFAGTTGDFVQSAGSRYFSHTPLCHAEPLHSATSNRPVRRRRIRPRPTARCIRATTIASIGSVTNARHCSRQRVRAAGFTLSCGRPCRGWRGRRAGRRRGRRGRRGRGRRKTRPSSRRHHACVAPGDRNFGVLGARHRHAAAQHRRRRRHGEPDLGSRLSFRMQPDQRPVGRLLDVASAGESDGAPSTGADQVRPKPCTPSIEAPRSAGSPAPRPRGSRSGRSGGRATR